MIEDRFIWPRIALQNRNNLTASQHVLYTELGDYCAKNGDDVVRRTALQYGTRQGVKDAAARMAKLERLGLVECLVPHRQWRIVDFYTTNQDVFAQAALSRQQSRRAAGRWHPKSGATDFLSAENNKPFFQNPGAIVGNVGKRRDLPTLASAASALPAPGTAAAPSVPPEGVDMLPTHSAPAPSPKPPAPASESRPSCTQVVPESPRNKLLAGHACPETKTEDVDFAAIAARMVARSQAEAAPAPAPPPPAAPAHPASTPPRKAVAVKPPMAALGDVAQKALAAAQASVAPKPAPKPAPAAYRPRGVNAAGGRLGVNLVAREGIAEGPPCNLGDVEAFVAALNLAGQFDHAALMRLFGMFQRLGATGMELGHAAWSTQRQGQKRRIYDPCAYAVRVWRNQLEARGKPAGTVVPLRPTG